MDKIINRLLMPKEDPEYNNPVEVNGFTRDLDSGTFKPVKLIIKSGQIYEVKTFERVINCDFDGDDV